MRWFQKKQRPNLTVNVEINYDKLGQSIADAIVKKEKEEAEQYSATREWLKIIMQPMLIIFCIFMAVLMCVFFNSFIMSLMATFQNATTINWREIVKAVIFAMLGLISMGLGGFSFFANREIEKENDRRYISSLFSNVVALMALIVALIALLKDTI